MWMVYISLEEKHKAESLGTPVRDLAQGIMGASVKTLEKGSLNSLNGTKDKMNVTLFVVVVVVVFEETQRQRKERPITAHAQLKEKQEREPGP